ncbi:MAG: hypothetical protein NXI31_03155 [bacterium]|nr:hypothetical protein [bacterium]
MNRPPVPTRLLSILTLTGLQLSAQTYVVDAANGPGTNFLEIATAIAAVPDGSTLVVRPGNYLDFTIDGMGITILADNATLPSSNGFGAVQIYNLAVHQSVVLRGLTLAAGSVFATGNAGRIVLEDITLEQVHPPNSHPLGGLLRLQSCSQVLLDDCLFHRVTSRASTLVARRLTVANRYSYSVSYPLGTITVPAAPGIELDDSRAELQNSTIRFASAVSASNTAPAITLHRSDLRIVSGTYESGLTFPFSTYTGPAITGTGEADLDPAAVFQVGSFPIAAATVQTTMTDLPELSISPATLGGTIVATVQDPVGHLAIVALGLPGTPIHIPGIAAPLWLDPNVWLFAAVGNAPVTAQQFVPGNSGFLGLQLMWQGVTWDSTTGLVASLPALGVVH